eukprot:COSAG02_NODE_6564_length_3490_cov_1.803182_2_plen_201_part_00
MSDRPVFYRSIQLSGEVGRPVFQPCVQLTECRCSGMAGLELHSAVRALREGQGGGSKTREQQTLQQGQQTLQQTLQQGQQQQTLQQAQTLQQQTLQQGQQGQTLQQTLQQGQQGQQQGQPWCLVAVRVPDYGASSSSSASSCALDAASLCLAVPYGTVAYRHTGTHRDIATKNGGGGGGGEVFLLLCLSIVSSAPCSSVA